MAIIAGQDSKLQIGRETTWGTGVAPDTEIDFTSEDLKLILNYIEEDALLGRKTTGRMDKTSIKTEGSFGMIVKPDNIGLLLACALGTETAIGAPIGATSSVYSHIFSPIVGGTGSSLPKLTIVVDRQVAVFGYVSSKIASFTFEAAVQDYLRATFEIRGFNEQSDALEALSANATRPFLFNDGLVSVDGTTWEEVADLKINFTNNLEDDLFVMNGSTTMAEIEPQKRDITIDLEVLYSATVNTARTNKYVAGATVALIANFTSSEAAEGAEFYQMIITCPLAYITEAHPVVSGPERLRLPLTLRATEDDSNEAITIKLINKDNALYLS